MSISINNNLHTQIHNPTAKSSKATTGSFTMPNMGEQNPVELAEPYSKEKLSEEDFRFIYNDLTSRARVLPPDVGMNEEQFLAFQEARTAKIVFEFGEGGSIRIKDGLSPEDYARAKATLRDYEFWLSGGTLPQK